MGLVTAQMWDGHMGWGGGWAGMMLVWIVVLVLLAWVVWMLAQRGFGGPGGRARERADAESIVRERYARGEIDAATYRNMLEELRR